VSDEGRFPQECKQERGVPLTKVNGEGGWSRWRGGMETRFRRLFSRNQRSCYVMGKKEGYRGAVWLLRGGGKGGVRVGGAA